MIDARIKIRHLQCFLETARLRHVGRAADRLCVTQPAVSKTLRELEDILAVRLFERSGRGLALTSVGRLFQEHAQTGGFAAAGDRQRDARPCAGRDFMGALRRVAELRVRGRGPEQ